MSHYYQHNPDEPIRHEWVTSGRKTPMMMTPEIARRVAAMEAGSAALIADITTAKTSNLPLEIFPTLRKAYEIGFMAGMDFIEKSTPIPSNDP